MPWKSEFPCHWHAPGKSRQHRHRPVIPELHADTSECLMNESAVMRKPFNFGIKHNFESVKAIECVTSLLIFPMYLYTSVFRIAMPLNEIALLSFLLNTIKIVLHAIRSPPSYFRTEPVIPICSCDVVKENSKCCPTKLGKTLLVYSKRQEKLAS